MPTKIPYVNEVWNPVVGCTKCSPGCLNCYAEKMAVRLSASEDSYFDEVMQYAPPGESTFGRKYSSGIVNKSGWTGKIFCDEKALDIPLHWRKPRKILCCSMADLFHEKVPFEFIHEIWDIMKKCPQHRFMVLTKRIERMAEIVGIIYKLQMLGHVKGFWNHVWPGATVCNQEEANKIIPILLQIPAAHRWVSVEPLLSEIYLTPWLKADTIESKKEQSNERKRNNVSEPGGIGCIQYRQQRQDMAAQTIGGRQSNRDTCATTPIKEAQKGGEVNIKESLESSLYSKQKALCSICPSNGLDIISQTTHTRGVRDKSQRRSPPKQSNIKSGNCYTSTKHNSCSENIESNGQKSPTRRGQCNSKINQRTSERNKRTLQKQNLATAEDRGNVRNQTKHCVEHTFAKQLVSPPISQIVIGCESGPNRRPCKQEWIKSLYDQCKVAGVDVMVKQMEIAGKVCHDPEVCERRLIK